jgi:hypothetical protein
MCLDKKFLHPQEAIVLPCCGLFNGSISTAAVCQYSVKPEKNTREWNLFTLHHHPQYKPRMWNTS